MQETGKVDNRRQAFAVLAGFSALNLLAFGITVLVTADQGWTKDDLDRVLPRGEDSAVPAPAADKVRQPTVAGQFYPAEAAALQAMVKKFLAAGPNRGLPKVHAVLVPHAGYVYSGEIAAASFREVGRDFKRVFLLAANHNGAADFAGVSLPDYTAMAIPGATVPVAVPEEFRTDALFRNVPEAHVNHMLEVELPFLQAVKGEPAHPDYTVVPLILGRMDINGITRLADLLARHAGPGALFVFSVDLSHFHEDAEARRLDSHALESLMAMDTSELTRAGTDGNHVLAVLALLAAGQGWEATQLGYRNSGDASGDKSRVVGYGAVAFHEPFRLDGATKQELLGLARLSIAGYLEKGVPPPLPEGFTERRPAANIPRGVFVTLKKNGKLRGCIGRLISTEPLWQGVQACAIDAAVKDARFQPVTRGELDGLTLSISVLQYPQRVRASGLGLPTALRPHRDGVILSYQGRRSTFLPEVWEQIPEPTDFLGRLCEKQGSPAACWQDASAVALRYGAYVFGEGEGE